MRIAIAAAILFFVCAGAAAAADSSRTPATGATPPKSTGVQAGKATAPSAKPAKANAPATKDAGTTALERLAAKGWGVNQPGTNYFTSCYPYRNLMRLAVPSWDANDGGVDAANWLTNLPAGGQATTRITAETSYVPPGDYVVRSESGAFCTISDNGGIITNVVQGTNAKCLCTFTVPEFPVGDPRYHQMSLAVGVHNGTDKTITSVADVYIGLAANFAGHSFSRTATAEQIFEPRYLADLAGCGAMKYADWQLMNHQDDDRTVVPEDLAKESNRSWSMSQFLAGGWGGNGIPHSVVAKLCAKIGMAIWPCFPPVYNFYHWTANAGADTLTLDPATFGPMVWNAGQPIVSVDGGPAAPLAGNIVYYVIRVDPTHIKLAASAAEATAGSAIDITQDGAAFYLRGIYDPGPVYDAIVDEIHAAAPGIDLVPQFALEPWNPAFYWNQTKTICSFYPSMQGEIDMGNVSQSLAWRMTRIWQSVERRFPRSQYVRLIENQGSAFDYSVPDTYDYIDKAGRAGVKGARLGDIVDVSSSAYYPHFKATPSTGIGPYGGDGQFMEKRDLIALGAETWTDAQWSRYIRNGIDRGYYWHRRDRAVLDLRTHRHIPMITYEGGLTEGLFGAINPYGQGHQGFTLSGNRLLFANTGGPGAAQQYEGYPITIHGTGTLPSPLVAETQYYAKNVDANGIELSATPGGPAIALTGTLSGTYTFGNDGDACYRLGKRHYEYTQSAQNGLDYTYYLDGLKDSGFIHYTQYTSASGIAFSKTSTGQWGWKNSQYQPDNAGIAAVKAYHFTPPAMPSPTWVDTFDRAWTTAPSSGAFIWQVEAGTPETNDGKLGGKAMFRIGAPFAANDQTIKADITFLGTVGGIYPEMRIGGVDADNHFGVLFANTQPTLFKRVKGVYSAIGNMNGGLPDNATIADCRLVLKTSRGGGIDLEFKVGERIVAYSYGNDPAQCPPRGNRFALQPESTIRFDNVGVY